MFSKVVKYHFLKLIYVKPKKTIILIAKRSSIRIKKNVPIKPTFNRPHREVIASSRFINADNLRNIFPIWEFWKDIQKCMTEMIKNRTNTSCIMKCFVKVALNFDPSVFSNCV